MIWALICGVLVAVICMTSYVRVSLRQLRRVAARGIFTERNGGERSGNERNGGERNGGERNGGKLGRIKLDRERATVSLIAFHTVLVGLLGLCLSAYRLGEAPSTTEALVQAFVGLGVILAIFDQLVPSLWVARRKDPEATIREWGPAVTTVHWLIMPLTFPLWISSTLRSLIKPIDPEPEAAQQQEAIQDLIEAGQEEGLIEESDREMIQSVVEFGDKTVREVMTPRHEIAALDFRSSVKELRSLFGKKKHRRIVVYADDMDHVLGVASVGDLLEMTPEEEEKATLKSLISPVRYVPETKKVSGLLKELQQETLQMAVVIDEYGAVGGLVTIEDLIEEIVGEIRDEVEPHEDDIRRESKNTFLVAGHTEVSQLADLLRAPVEGKDYTTVSGLIVSVLGRVPSMGEQVEKGGLRFEVLESNARTVLRVRVVAPLSAVESSQKTSHAP